MDAAPQRLLGALREGDAGAWEQFLQLYAGVVYQVAAWCTRDPEDAADCFAYACERLHEKGCRRLRKFDPKGLASFTTWLRAVVRNLCLDWLRSRYGRKTVFRSIARLSPLEVEVYRCRVERGLSEEESLQRLRARFPDLTPEQVETAEGAVRLALSSRQNWRTSLAPANTPGAAADDSNTVLETLVDESPSPEELAAQREDRSRLATALSQLSSDERLLLRLRFAEELTLAQVAHVMGLADAQTADRRLQSVLNRLRTDLDGEPRKIAAAFRVKKVSGYGRENP